SRLPPIAAFARASSLLVVLPMADTTTIGLRSRRAFTIPATRSMACADSTDVPPNFITIMSVEQTFRLHQFSIQHCRPRGAPNRVMPERHELPAEHRTWPQPADERCHATLTFRIFARLGPVRFRHILHRAGGSARQLTLLRHAPKRFHCVAN